MGRNATRGIKLKKPLYFRESKLAFLNLSLFKSIILEGKPAKGLATSLLVLEFGRQQGRCLDIIF
jgi:hypothetical protein